MTGPGTTAGGATDGPLWVSELDRIELDVIRAERALAEGAPVLVEAWTPRRDLGPLPRTLVGRATQLLDRQRECLLQMARQLGRARQQQAVCSTISSATAHPQVPVYVDLPL